MAVRLVSYSQPALHFLAKDIDDAQDLIAFCARVSNLAKHKHWSPFEMVNACLEIDTTRDIAHQIVRHRSFSFQEFSQRYANPEDMGDIFVHREARLQDPKNRQNSIETNDTRLQMMWSSQQNQVIDQARRAYEWALQNGIAKEQARAVLPEGLTRTRLYMNGTLRSWIHYIELRSANGTQKEHMEIAIECAKAIAEIFPSVNDYVDTSGHI